VSKGQSVPPPTGGAPACPHLYAWQQVAVGEPVLSHLANQAPHLDAHLAAGERVTREAAHRGGQHRLSVYQHTHLLQLAWDGKPFGLPGCGVQPI
jgi:hypothetical protein